MIDLKAGSYFFHYTTREAAFEHILPARELRLSPYAWMRDPLEAKEPWLSAGFFVPDDPDGEAKLREAYSEAQARIAEERAGAKLLSLSVDASPSEEADEVFGRGFARARMWEHYAESHQGVCLVFERDELTNVIEQHVDDRNGRLLHGPVRYSETGFCGTPATVLQPTTGVTGEALASDHLGRHAGSFFLLKLLDWESEHEYRFVEQTPGNGYTYVGYGDALKAVILGEKFPSWQIYGAIEMCKAQGAKLWQMAWQMNRPLPGRPRLPDGKMVNVDGTTREPPGRPFSTADLAAAMNRGPTRS